MRARHLRLRRRELGGFRLGGGVMATSGCGVKRSSRWSDAGSRGLRELGVSGRDGKSSAAQALDGGSRRFKCGMEEGRRLKT